MLSECSFGLVFVLELHDLSSMCCALSCIFKGTNCLPLLLFLISLALVTSGIAWLHTRGVWGMDLLFVFVWLCERLVCLDVDCLVVTLRVHVFESL